MKNVEKNANFANIDQIHFALCADDHMTVRGIADSMIKEIRKENQQMQEYTDRFDEEEKDSVAAIDKKVH